MVVLDIISADGATPNPPVRVGFDEAGGTIGRAPTNTLALPDPRKTVSRVHAQILRRQHGVVIISRSSNELLIDGAPLELGEETLLPDGAQIEMGSYTLRATLKRAPPKAGPSSAS